tara:strand:- start:2353 stop:2502 length:150 start_codon:yes stop_codon:yes gene_type:complete
MDDEITPKAMLGECIYALNLAVRQIDNLGGDSTLQREAVERAGAIRWSA